MAIGERGSEGAGGVRVERRFRRRLDALEEIFAFVDRFVEPRTQAEDLQRAIGFVIEELFTNMIKYARGGQAEIRLALEASDEALTITLTDFDVDPFDIRTAPPPDLARPVAERTPGGLGLHLVRELMDGVEYHYQDRTSTTTLTKRLG